MKRRRFWPAALAVALLSLPTVADATWPDSDGSGDTSWLSALQLVDPHMASAVNQASWEWHHWSIKDMRPTAFNVIPSVSWAELNTACTQGVNVHAKYLVYDFAVSQSCGSGTGGGNLFFDVCRCDSTDGVSYVPADINFEANQSYWSASGTVNSGVNTYPTDLQNIAYPKPMVRLDFNGASECAATEEVSDDAVFQSRDNPVFYIEATPWNWNAQVLATAATTLSETISIIGWRRSDPSAGAEPGFGSYIDPAVAGVSAIIEAQIHDFIGLMWVSSKWYFVMVKDELIVQNDVVLDPVAVYGSLENYISQHMGGSIAFAFQSDVDFKGNGRRRGAYQVINNIIDSTNWHSSFTPFTISSGVGGPKSGYLNVGGIGREWHRVVAACSKSTATTNLGRFFFTQMDVIK